VGRCRFGAWCLVLGAWCLVLGAWCLVLGAWCLVLGAWCLVLGAWCLVKAMRQNSENLEICLYLHLSKFVILSGYTRYV